MLALDMTMDKPDGSDALTAQQVLHNFRAWGYLQADLDWLGRLKPEPHPELDIHGPGVEEARRFYCGRIAAEFMHIPDPGCRGWIQERMESEPEPFDSRSVLELLMRATTFEQLLQTRYIGNKRFSLEGLESLVPLLVEMLETASGLTTDTAMLAMSHRGRLNVMGHVVGCNPVHLFAGFEDVDPRSIMGAGDVKYHLGATGLFHARNGREMKIHLVSNPSHLEAVNPIAMGRVRAKQTRHGGDARRKMVPILMHGDAAFAGQGIAAECLNLANIEGFSVGGTVHIIVNNWIGFTTEPHALQSSRFSSDIAKRMPIPIFHVNADHPDSVIRAARLAMQYRDRFMSDVVVNLIGHRRHGHSEVDDPTITQPQLYAEIKARPPLWQTYAEHLRLTEDEITALEKGVRADLSAAKDQAEKLTEIPVLRALPSYWEPYVGGAYKPEYDGETGIMADEIAEITERLTGVPDGFNLHPKMKKLLEQRRRMGLGEQNVDYGMAEALAIGSLVRAGHPVRFSGQDTRRGTFSHRHSVLIDTENGREHCALQSLCTEKAFFEIYNSVLSEVSVLGYEYGFSRDYPEALVAWEAQFGDFANGAQVIFDQFLAAGEDKWGLLSSLVVLLPHGFEGQGPEHSSARIERFLQLAAEDAIQVTQPTTAAQYFHLLRRQVLRSWRKPLIVFTPKSMLRYAGAASPIESFSRQSFLNVMPDREITDAKRVILCTGKIAHELRAERKKRGIDSIAIVSIEQLYPFPRIELGQELDKYGSARDIVWVQEEPANMGARFFVVPLIEQVSRGRRVRSIKRAASASPATGSAKAHAMEQRTLIELALS